MTRFMFIGAHPDDADIRFGGTAWRLAKAGHAIKFVSVCNGDCGHLTMQPAELAARRYGEAQASAKLAGLAEYQIMNNHDCELEPTLENRKELIRIIRRFAPDVVITHRLCDYHPDHRATAQLVLDTAYVLMVPHFCPEVPMPKQAPVYCASYDRFVEPRPFRADAAVEIDSVMEEKLHLLDCHVSQFYEWLAWEKGIEIDPTKVGWDEKRALLMKSMERFRFAAGEARGLLKKVYGEAKGNAVKYAEVFEQWSYSRVVPQDEFQKFFMA